MNDLVFATAPSALDAGDLRVHPLAALFPMLPDDELAELADDILANGLIHPIIIDHAGEMLVDGRNRLAACKLAGVEPRFERLAEGVEPRDYIIAANLRRRNITAGQRAMALAMLYPKPKRGVHSELGGLTGDFSKERLSKARTVVRHSPDELAPLVLSGVQSLDAAFRTVREREQAAASEDAKLARLRTEAPDVADLVVEGSITIAAGLAEIDERARKRRIAIENGHQAAAEIAMNFEADVAAIIAAIEAGDPPRLDKSVMDRIATAHNLLKARRHAKD